MGDSSQDHKTGRVALLSGVLVCMGLMFFLYKTDACKSDPHATSTACKEEFIEFVPQGGCGAEHKCSEGAVIEIVNSPQRSGTLCHCINNIKSDAGHP